MFKKLLNFQMDVCTIIEMNPYDLSYIVKKKEGGFSKNAIMMLVGHIKE